MKYIKSFNEFMLTESYSDKVIANLIIKFKLEDSNLTDEIIKYYINEFDKFKSSPKIINKDILKYTFKELETLIDSMPKKVNKELINSSYDSNDIIYDENGLIVLKGDTKEKCIKYGKGYTWCISRNDSSNMFNTYRYRYDEINFYFVFDKDLPKSNPNHALVILVDRNNKYYLANADNSGDFAGTTEYTFNKIIKFQPKLTKLKKLFKSLPLTQKEKEIHSKIKNRLSEDDLLNHFSSYEIVESYLAYGHRLTDNQYENIDNELKNKYINLGHVLTAEQMINTSDKLMERYHSLRTLQHYLDLRHTKKEQINLTRLDCSSNNLTSLKGIEILINLTELYCSDNNLTSLKGIENLINLTELGCSYNDLTSLEDIENLINLTKLYCSDNNLTSLKGIENLINLTEFVCSYNPNLTSLKGIENLIKLNILDCSNNINLTSLKGIEKLINLTNLKCSHNPNLTSLKGIENLINLTRLDCYDNPNLTSLKGIENLINLTYLDCSNNAKLPKHYDLKNLDKLRKQLKEE